ncbi:MAG: DNA polymerase III subunit delta [Dehalococcoidales bacterium]|nr:MAG: DNA polymerase III subunit delta [Dehalococcoidales bacterium]
MIYVLSGQDDFSVAQALEDIKKDLGDEASLAMSTTVLDGNQLTFEELKNVCETIPFMTEKRLVIVEGLLGRFESGTRARRQTKTSKKSKKQEEAEVFADYLTGGIPDSTILVVTEGTVSGDNPIFKSLAGKAVTRSFALPRDAKLREWVQKRVKDEGGEISPRAVHLLARLVGSNLWIMASEIEKLLLYTNGSKIEEMDVQVVVGYNQQATVFNMVDAILEFKAELAEKMLESLFRSGMAPVYLLFMIARQVQLVVRVKELNRKRSTNREMQGKLGISSEWVLKKTIDQASRYSSSRLKDVYRRLLDTDIAIKTGKMDPELALNVLVAELCRQSNDKPVRNVQRI